MTDPEPKPEFDVFIAYNSQDPVAAEAAPAIHEELRAQGYNPWLADRDAPLGGVDNAEIMEQAIAKSKCCAMLFGEQELGRWQGWLELSAAVELAVEDQSYRVFAVLLPGAEPKKLPLPLRRGSRADLRNEYVRRTGLTEAGRLELRAAVTAESREKAGQELKAADAAAGRHRALLIGVSKYDDRELINLSGPRNDISNVKKALGDVGAPRGGDWEVTLLPDPQLLELVTGLTKFLDDGTSADTLLVYYSGHGHIGADDSYICARNTVVDANQLSFTAVRATQIAAWLTAGSAASTVVILDCCNAAPIEASAYDKLDESVAVVLASHGPVGDAAAASESSPFTQNLISVLRDTDAYGPEGLTVGHILTALERLDETPSTNANCGRSILLTRPSVALPPAEDLEQVPSHTIGVSAGAIAPGRLALLRQFALTLDSLLAAAPDEDRVPAAVVSRSMHLIAGELREGLPPEELRILAEALDDATPPTCAIRFADKKVREQLADLPWEYLALYADEAGGDEGRGEELLRKPPIVVQREFDVPPMKLVPGTRVQQATLFSSLVPIEQQESHDLTAATMDQLERHGIKVSPFLSAQYSTFSSAPPTSDVVILQIPVRLVDSRIELDFIGPERAPKPISADTVSTRLQDWPALTWLFIETIAEESSDQPAIAVRRLARTLAEDLKRPVVGVCHPRAYSSCVRENPDAPVFLAALLNEMRRGSPLDQAAHNARCTVVKSLPILKPAIVGMPIVVMPVQRAVREEPARRETDRRTVSR